MNQVITKPRITKICNGLWACTSGTTHYAEGRSPELAYRQWKFGRGFHSFYWRD